MSKFISIGPDEGSEFDRLVGDRPAFVKFYRKGCPACDAMADEWAGLEGEMEGLQGHGANIIEVDEKAIPDIKSSCARGIEGVPTIMVVKIGGDMSHEYEGPRDKEAFLKEYREHFSKEMGGGGRKPKGRRSACRTRCVARAKRRCAKRCTRFTRKKSRRGRTKKKTVRKSRKSKRGKRRGTRKIPKKRRRSARKGGTPPVPMTRMAPGALFDRITAGIKEFENNDKIIDLDGYLALMVYQQRVQLDPDMILPSPPDGASGFDNKSQIKDPDERYFKLNEFESPEAGLGEEGGTDEQDEERVRQLTGDTAQSGWSDAVSKFEAAKRRISEAIPFNPMDLNSKEFKAVYGVNKPDSGGRRRRR